MSQQLVSPIMILKHTWKIKSMFMEQVCFFLLEVIRASYQNSFPDILRVIMKYYFFIL